MTNLDSSKGIKLELPKGLALEPAKGLLLELPKGAALEPPKDVASEPSALVDPPTLPLAMSELVGDGPTLDPCGDEIFVCEIDDLY